MIARYTLATPISKLRRNKVCYSQALRGHSMPENHSEVTGKEKEQGPGVLSLLRWRVGGYGFVGSLFIGEFKT